MLKEIPAIGQVAASWEDKGMDDVDSWLDEMIQAPPCNGAEYVINNLWEGLPIALRVKI
jgi:hypothetical protein